MNKFNFTVDFQCTVWCRNNLTIEAKDREEAMAKLMETIIKDPQFKNGYVDIKNEWEYLPETEEIIERFSLDDPATIEVYEEGTAENCMIWNNRDGEVKPQPKKSPQEQKRAKVLNLLSKAFSSTEKEFFSQEELDDFASWYIRWDSHTMKKEAVAEAFLEYGDNGMVCRRCAECGRLTKEGWYVNDIQDHVCSVTCLASVLNRLFSEDESNYRFELD